jgi:hypothetical protein
MGHYTKLALQVWQSRNEPRRAAAVETSASEIHDFATRTARMIHKSHLYLKNVDADDFIAGSSSCIFTVLGKFVATYEQRRAAGVCDTAADPFAAWTRTVLENLYIDWTRRIGRFEANRRKLVRDEEQGLGELIIGGGDARFTLTLAELQEMDSWNAIDRIVLVGVLRCWHHVPAEMWRRWLREANIEQFPADSLLAARKGQQREILAHALRIKNRNGIDQRLRRIVQRRKKPLATTAP